MYKRHLVKLSRTRLDDVLIDEGVLERAQIEDAQAESEMTGRTLSHILFERNEIDEWDLAKLVARTYSLPFIDVVRHAIPREAEALLDVDFCRQHLLAPFDIFGDFPAIAVCEVPTDAVLEEIESTCGRPPFVYVTLRSGLLAVLDARDGQDTAASGIRKAAERSETVSVVPTSTVEAPAPTTVRAPAAVGGLPPASMRLGFSMHGRGAQAVPPPKSLPRSNPAPTRAAAAPAAPATPSDGKAAAWQSIFDLGDDAV